MKLEFYKSDSLAHLFNPKSPLPREESGKCHFGVELETPFDSIRAYQSVSKEITNHAGFEAYIKEMLCLMVFARLSQDKRFCLEQTQFIER